jgi:hypothetical protein
MLCEALERSFEIDITTLTTEQLTEHSVKQAAYEQIIENYEARLKRKRGENSMVPVSESYANRIYTNKLESLIKARYPELLSASQSAFDV